MTLPALVFLTKDLLCSMLAEKKIASQVILIGGCVCAYIDALCTLKGRRCKRVREKVYSPEPFPLAPRKRTVVFSGSGHNCWCCAEAGRRSRRAAAAGTSNTVEVAEGKQLKEIVKIPGNWD